MSDFQRIENVYRNVRDLAPRLPFHNLEHLIDVSESCRMYARLEGLEESDAEILRLAGMLHRIVHRRGEEDNAERSAYEARRILKRCGYSSEEIDRVEELIWFTKYEREPKNINEKIMHDSDWDPTGRNDFLEKSEMLRLEEGIDFEKWYREIEPDFLDRVKYYTDSAKSICEYRLKENIKELDELCE